MCVFLCCNFVEGCRKKNDVSVSVWRICRISEIRMTVDFMSSSELHNVGVGIRLQMTMRCICSDKILGMDPQPPTANVNELEGTQDTGASLFAFLGDDARQVDAAQADAKFHQSPPILQSTERCEMAFKGRRDMVLFTTKRLVIVDVKGFSGTKTSFLSLPWSTVKCFGVKSAGSFLDKDSEMMIWCVRLCFRQGFRIFLCRGGSLQGAHLASQLLHHYSVGPGL